ARRLPRRGRRRAPRRARRAGPVSEPDPRAVAVRRASGPPPPRRSRPALLIMKIRSIALLVSVFSVALGAQNRAPKTHRLEATPNTVAYGYYWSEAKPVLLIAAGGVVHR